MTDELSPSEVARRLGTSTRTVQRWIADGRLPARRVGGRWRVAYGAFGAFGALSDAQARPHGTAPTRPSAGIDPIRTLFIANRGEIAVRIGRTCARLGIRAVVPQTDGPDALDLLDADSVVSAALRERADALHPGFGFLAEDAAFAHRVIAAGIRWVGPPPDAMRAMGDKAASRRLAASLGVPIPAGYDDADQSDETLTRAAAAIGLPLLVKPAAGGGGKGMRTVRDANRLLDALAGARREAAAAFGDDRLILERLVEGARHVEIQVLFDRHGHGVHLGERDCSIQRRHQKILEETPSPAIDPDVRGRMAAAALSLAGSVGYENAGTCEFLVDERGAFTFLEMNTRLQVEHPVTELVTGRDLVADQLRIAAGEPLGLAQADVRFEGHAVEVRLYAEDAEHGSLPATGRIERLRWPSGEGIRVDAGVVEGDDVGGRFDPMLAKIIAHADDRGTALARLAAALDATVVLGLTTNLRFLRWLVRQPVVLDGAARTDTLERIWPPDDWTDRARIPDAAWSAAAAALLDGDVEPGTTGGSSTSRPWTGGFRLNGPAVVRVTTDDEARTVHVDREAADRDGGLVGELVAALVRAGDVVHLDLGGRSTSFRLAPPPDVERAALAAARIHGGGPQELVAPMPGQVVALMAEVGASVEAGDPIVTLEAMKMEHAVHATGPGTITAIFVAMGEQVQRGQRLAVVE